MEMTKSHALAAGGLALALAISAVWAQETVRVRGVIERVDGNVYVVKDRKGSELRLTLATKAAVAAGVKSTLGSRG
jgi:hypothetical protein